MSLRRILAFGVFDLFHIGHLRYLQYARTRGMHLTVGVMPDAISYALKGKYPVIPEISRQEIISGLGWVDIVKPMPTSTETTMAAAEWIAAWQIDHVVVGGVWSDSERWQRLIPMLREQQISVEFAPHTEGISTSEIITRIKKSHEV